MKSLKGKGGVIGRGLSDNVLKVWTKTMHRCAEITEAVEEISNKKYSEVHHDKLAGRVNRDNKDFIKLLDFFWAP